MHGKVLDTLMTRLGDRSGFKSDSMEPSREILSRLKFIGYLKRNEKVNTKHVFVQPDGIFTSISRTLYHPESRSSTLSFLQSTITRSFEIMDLYSRATAESDRLLYMNIIADLTKAQVGLENLKYTYNHDIKFCCDVDTLNELIVARLSNIPPTMLEEATTKLDPAERGLRDDSDIDPDVQK